MDQNPWNQGQNYWQGNSYRPPNNGWPAPMPGQPASGQQAPLTQSMPFPSSPAPPLSRAERLEAQRLSYEANFSFDGYQVVRREFISHRFDPAMTIRGDSIVFNNSCISKLEDATYVQFLINPDQQRMIIRPCSEGARDAVRWCVIKADKRKSRQITCKMFTAKLYDMMGWETLYRYRMQGMQIKYDGELMWLFDLSSTECFLPQTRDPETGKIKRPTPIMPGEWRDQFGMSVPDHAASTQVDLNVGFKSPEMLENDNSNESQPVTENDAEASVEITKEGTV